MTENLLKTLPKKTAVNNAVLNNNGNLWFGTKYFGISRYDGKNFITFSDYENGK